MKEKLMNDLVNAMKNKDKETLAVLRMLKGAIQLEEINNKHELTDSEFISVLSKQIKMRKEFILEFTKAGREYLLNQTQNEIEILSKYMPEQLKEEEVLKIIDEVFLVVKPESNKDMGKVMGLITPKLKGKADMSFVSKIIRERLSNM